MAVEALPCSPSGIPREALYVLPAWGGMPQRGDQGEEGGPHHLTSCTAQCEERGHLHRLRCMGLESRGRCRCGGAGPAGNYEWPAWKCGDCDIWCGSHLPGRTFAPRPRIRDIQTRPRPAYHSARSYTTRTCALLPTFLSFRSSTCLTMGGDKLMEQIFNLKFMAKQLSRAAVKSEKVRGRSSPMMGML